MLIKMLETCHGSPDGIRVLDYEGGETYNVPGELADMFIDEGFAEPAVEGQAPGRAEAAGHRSLTEVIIDTGDWPLEEADKRLPNHKLAFQHDGTRVFIGRAEQGLETLSLAALKDVAKTIGLPARGKKETLLKAIGAALGGTK